MGLFGTVAVVYGVPAGLGGLGIQSANAISDWAMVADRVIAIGPGRIEGCVQAANVQWVLAHGGLPPVFTRYTWLRWLHGRRQFLTDQATGNKVVGALKTARPDIVYAFTQVALEPLSWANQKRILPILESPNGHIQNFRDVYIQETLRFGGKHYLGHPSTQMVKRVKAEYSLAKIIRVSSEWAKTSIIKNGVNANKIIVICQRPTAEGYSPALERLPEIGPLRVCFVGSLDLRKGFVYLLRAIRQFGASRITLRLVGGTVDRFTRRLLMLERQGIQVELTPGDPKEALRWAELFVLPTLEDGSPFALIEAMATGVPSVVTDACGNSPLVRHGETGWIIPAGDVSALAAVLEKAWERRGELRTMGEAARRTWEELSANYKNDLISSFEQLASISKACRLG